MAEPLPLTSIIRWNRDGTVCEPTEHSRSELSVDFERTNSSDRMADATLRQYYVADKRSWSVSWDMVPAPTSETVDGKAGGAEMQEFYYNTPVEFDMTIQHADSNLDETVKVVFSSFSKTHVRRGLYDFWDVSVGLDEV